MAINNITQTISTIPEAAHRGVDVQTQFVIKQEDFQDHLQGTTVTELNTLKDQLNSRIGEINSTTTTMNGYANTASAGASTATTKAGEASTSAGEALAYRNQTETFKNNASTSATKASQWADNNYNVEVETGKYSAKHWSTVAQNATANKIDKVTSTDNAVVRFDGITGQVQNSGVTIDDNGTLGIGNTSDNSTRRLGFITASGGSSAIESVTIGGTDQALVFKTTYATESEKMRLTGQGSLLLTSGTGGLGYGTGAGGIVTQLTSKSTAVTLNKPTGVIVMNDSALAAGASVEFLVHNYLISHTITDTVILSGIWGVSPLYRIEIGGVYTSGFMIRVTNITAGNLSDSVAINFTIIKGANS